MRSFSGAGWVVGVLGLGAAFWAVNASDRDVSALVAELNRSDSANMALAIRLDSARRNVQVESVTVDLYRDRWRVVRDTVVDTVSVPYEVFVEVRSVCDSLASACSRAQAAHAAYVRAVDSIALAKDAEILALRKLLHEKPNTAKWAGLGAAGGLVAGVLACRGVR